MGYFVEQVFLQALVVGHRVPCRLEIITEATVNFGEKKIVRLYR